MKLAVSEPAMTALASREENSLDTDIEAKKNFIEVGEHRKKEFESLLQLWQRQILTELRIVKGQTVWRHSARRMYSGEEEEEEYRKGRARQLGLSDLPRVTQLVSV